MLKSFAGGRLFGGTWGEKPARVLALHGWRRSHDDFERVSAELGGGTVAPDLPGFGATPPPAAPWDSRDYALAVAPLFDDPGLLGDRLVVVGHSFGGRVAIRLWELLPERIDAMVLTGVPLLRRADRRAHVAAPYRLGRRLHRLGLLSEPRMEALRQRYGSPDYRAAEGVMRDVFVRVLQEDYGPALTGLRCPVDLVWGAADDEVPVEVAGRARELLPDASLTVLPGIGHLVPTEAPGDLVRAVRRRAADGDAGAAESIVPVPATRTTVPAPAPGIGAPVTAPETAPHHSGSRPAGGR